MARQRCKNCKYWGTLITEAPCKDCNFINKGAPAPCWQSKLNTLDEEALAAFIDNYCSEYTEEEQ